MAVALFERWQREGDLPFVHKTGTVKPPFERVHLTDRSCAAVCAEELAPLAWPGIVKRAAFELKDTTQSTASPYRTQLTIRGTSARAFPRPP